MEVAHSRRWRGPRWVAALAVAPALALLAACAPLGATGAPPTPSRAELATVTANASATNAAGSAGSITLPPVHADPGWVAVVQVADGARLGGPEVTSSPPGAGTGSATMTLGSFKLSSAARFAMIFGCTSPTTIRASLQIGVDGAADTIQCSPSGATYNHSEVTETPSDVGRTLTVTATITTDGSPPQWYALVEQPK